MNLLQNKKVLYQYLLEGEDSDTESTDEDDPLTSFFRIQMNGLLSGRPRSRRPEPVPKLFTKLGY